jgi:hypothetical protein
MKYMEYNVDYFIEKFSAIPSGKWLINDYERNGLKCAFGHCGMRDNNSIERIPEAKALVKILQNVAIINDGDSSEYQQPTAKQRVLAALYDIKRKQDPEFNQPPVTVEQLIGQGEIVNQ